KVKSETVANCQRLSMEFQQYVVHTRSLRKVFLSIKGIYYQVEIKGQVITWLVPYQFSQRVPDDVDFRVMLTFLEFYQTLIGFVNFKLYTDSNLSYPPKLDILKDEGSGGLNVLVIEPKNVHLSLNSLNVEYEKKSRSMTSEEKVQKLKSEERLKTLSQKLDAMEDKESTDHLEDTETDVNENLMDEFIEQTSEQSTSQGQTLIYQDIYSASTVLLEFQQLFSKCIFYLSREVPKYSLEFVIRAFGGQVGWDDTVGMGSPFKEHDERITHYITDRQMTREPISTRIYVQPQWVYDCINARKLLRTKPYQPDKALPAHLSPFVEYKEGDYLPGNINDFEGTMEEMEVSDSQKDVKGDTKEDSDSDTDSEKEESETNSSDGVTNYAENNESEAEELIHQMELEAETIGIPFSKYQKNRERIEKQNKNIVKHEIAITGRKRSAKEIEEEETKELAKIMMPKKQKKLYNKMQYGKKKQEEKTLNLKRKKEILEKKKR
ncbi:2605_t:CDS:2, partial [Acaulospora morrowiae]